MKSIVLMMVIFLFAGCSSNNQKRVALVIGNQNYPSKSALANPIGDSKAMKKRLEALGFDVIYGKDISYQQFEMLLKTFQSKLNKETTAFFYFAGHGNTLQANSNETFLAMVDKKESVLVSIFKLYTILREANPKDAIVAIDSCQDYSGIDNKRGVYRGKLVRDEKIPSRIVKGFSPQKPNSIIISYATQPNEKASDKGVHNTNMSPYAYYLNRHLDDEEIPIQEVFRRVRKAMHRDFEGKQRSSAVDLLQNNIWLQPKRKVTAKINPF
ncbi:MAG: caspase family protein [Campylobacterales bacterium]|nr:caspase family protein [Campylobacterales bacterium]